MRAAARYIAVGLLLVGACAGRDEPRVEAWENGTYRPRALTAYAVSGRRDGATTNASATFTLDGGSHLRLDLAVTYDPTPALASGHWTCDGPGGGSGDVRAESIRFMGGQGQGPSLGGRFLLGENGAPRFRVVLPLRPLAASGWPKG
jgi:hypothetical protein